MWDLVGLADNNIWFVGFVKFSENVDFPKGKKKRKVGNGLHHSNPTIPENPQQKGEHYIVKRN